MGRARDISKVFSTGTALATDTEVSAFNYLTQSSASTVYQTKATAGLTLLTPGSITNTGGSASIGTNGTVSFTSASAISLNNVFSSTYENYKIVWYWTQAGGGATPFIRLRNGGVTESSQIYYSNEITTQSGSSTITNTTRDPISNIVFGESNVSGNYLEMTLFNPFAAARKGFLIQKVGSSATETYLGYTNGIIDRNTSCDGIHFEINANTMSGTVRIYGLAN